MDRLSRSPSLRSALLLGLVLLAHGPALRATQFHYDDGHSLVRNPHLRDLSRLPDFFTDPTLFGENRADAMYRPLVLTAHAVNAALAGTPATGGSPAGFVALNLALHAGATLLVGSLLPALGLGPGAALAGAALFGLHPLQTEVVNYVSARSESIAALGLLLGVWAALRYLRAAEGRWLALVVAAQWLAVGGKETGAVLPLLLAVITVWRRPPSARASAEGWRRWGPPLAAAAALLPYLLFYAGLRDTASGPAVRPLVAQAATQTKALVYYLRGLALPVDLSVYPQFRASPTPGESAVLMAAALVLSLAWCLLRSGRNRLWIGGTWWGLCLLPTLVVPLNILVNDHRPYAALAGAVLVLPSLPGRWPAAGRQGRRARRALLLAGVGILILLDWQRAGDWRTEVSLWTAAVREGPAVPAAHHNLGFAMHGLGDAEGARRHYERAIALDPDYGRPLTNLGALYREAGDLEGAAALLRRAVAAEPGAVEPRSNLGLVYAATGQLDRAIATYRQALEIDPGVAEIWLNLGLALRDAGRREEAAACLRRALQLDPGVRQRLQPR